VNEEIEGEIDQIESSNLVSGIERTEDGINVELFVYHDQLPELIALLKKAEE